MTQHDLDRELQEQMDIIDQQHRQFTRRFSWVMLSCALVLTCVTVYALGRV